MSALTPEQIRDTTGRVIEEFMRRAREAGPEQALEEAADWHPGAALMIADFLRFVAAVTAP